MTVLTKISQQTFWQILGKVVTSLSTFIILGVVARNYGEEATGVFTLALTYLAIFYLLADFGFNAHVLKKLKTQSSKLKTEWQKLLGTRILWSSFLVILVVITLPFWPFANSTFSQAVIFGVLAIIASAVFITCNLIFQSKLKYDLSVLASSGGTLISLAIFIYMASNGFPIPFLLFAHFLGWVIIAVVALGLVKIATSSPSARPRNDNGGIFPIFDIRYTMNLFKSSWPIAATLALNVVYFRADTFMISYFKSSAEVGIYNVAYSVFQSCLVLPTFIMNAYYPLMLKSLNGIKLVALGLLGLAVFGTLLTIIFSPLIIHLLTGSGFAGSVQSLQILSLGFPAYFISALLMWIFVIRGKYKSMLVIYFCGLIFNLFLNFILIPQYSFIAASWITVISEYLILGMQVMVLFLKR